MLRSKNSKTARDAVTDKTGSSLKAKQAKDQHARDAQKCTSTRDMLKSTQTSPPNAKGSNLNQSPTTRQAMKGYTTTSGNGLYDGKSKTTREMMKVEKGHATAGNVNLNQSPTTRQTMAEGPRHFMGDQKSKSTKQMM
eukprot:Selendium_serpulae@DN1933_c0_g1_i1.p1